MTKATVAAGPKTLFRVLGIACVCAGLMIAAPPAIAGVSVQPFLNFNVLAAPDDFTAAFEVTAPPNPIVPVEILSLMLVGTDPMVDVSPTVRDNNVRAVLVEFQLAGLAPPDDNTVAFDLLFDVASFLGSNPVLQLPPNPNISGPVPLFAVMFDVGIDGGIVSHVANFAAASGFGFSDIMTGAGSVAVGFDLTGPYTTGGPGLFTVTITGSASHVPEPATLAIFAFGLAALGFMARRRRKARAG